MRSGNLHTDSLNAEYDAAYLNDPRNPRWVAKPTVAYLHARTVACKQCRAMLPLLKTRWLCKKDRKRVLLTMERDAAQTNVAFGVQTDVPRSGGNAAQRREHDKRIGRRHDVTHRRDLSVVPRHHDDGRYPSGRTCRAAGHGR